MSRFLLSLCLFCVVASLRLHAALPAEGIFARTNLVAWCIVPFDSQKRGPEERAAMLNGLGITRLAYDWRAEHIPTFDAEVVAMRAHSIEITAWWFPAALNDEAKAILTCIEKNRIHPQLWVTMGTEPEPDAAKLAQKIEGAVNTLGPICTEAKRLGCTVALYNHLGWFGEPANQVTILGKLRAAGHANAGMVYNFHHAHSHLDDFAAQLRLMQPYLLALNLNGMIWEGDKVGKKIIPLGTGEEELRLLQIVNASGWHGPVGVIGHTEEDAEGKLKKELAGLEKLAPLAIQAPSPVPVRKPAAASVLEPVGAQLTDGKFGQALDARVQGVVLDGQAGFRQPPLTVEAWVRLGGTGNFNILAASEGKASPTHWELYTYSGDGDLSFYSPGNTPAEVRSGVNVCDGQWHHVAAQFSATHVRLFVDGKQATETRITRTHEGDGSAAQFAIGRLVEGGLGCHGLVDEVRVSRGLRVINGIPKEALAKDEATLAVWNLDRGATSHNLLTSAPKGSVVGDAKPLQSAAPANSKAGEPAMSGRDPGTQGEKDWVDNRWQDTDVGPFLASNLRLHDGSVIAKALAVRVGEKGEGAVVYDTETCTLRAAWTGGFLKFDPTRFGLIGMPRLQGDVFWTAPKGGEWPPGTTKFKGIHLTKAGPVLEYEVGGTRILDLPSLELTNKLVVLRRVLEVAPHARDLTFMQDKGGLRFQLLCSLQQQADGSDPRAATFLVKADTKPQQFRLGVFEHPKGRVSLGEPIDLAATVGKYTARWPTLATRGQRGLDTDILAVDTLALPYDNPEKALLFGAGVDFTPDGAGYLCTIHGDVWRVTGIDDSLRELKWQRYATGLFQPLGLKVRDGKVYVLGRDRITRLHDENGDGEADFYESFFDGIETSTGGHDYVTSLEKDDAGNFYYIDPKGVHRVAADGSRKETLATGFRNPNGMGVRPDGKVITAAPQQGEWTPSSGLWEIRADNVGLYGGYGGPKVSDTRPVGYDAPLCWMPHAVDNSSGGQVWVPAGQWGALGGQMLHLLWGRCGLMLTLRDTPSDGHGSQGAVVPLPAKFLSGPNRGTFNPKDGNLYVAGSTGWQTSAVKDGALQRVRYTGKPLRLPVAWKARGNQVEVTFSEALDRATAEDAGSYGVKAWNYRYAKQYGSKDWTVANPDKEGRDEWPVKSAKLSEDGRTVRLEVPDLKPVMQLELKYNVDAKGGGKAMRGSLWATINWLGDAR